MKTVYMHQVYMGNVGDMKNLEYHFAHMAEKGWMIDKIGLFTHRYHAIEPCKKSFFVDFLPQITAFDYPENEDAQEYRRICEASGWTFVAANKQFHVFCAEDNTPTPIHTDNQIQAQIHLRVCRKYELFPLIFPILMLGFLLFSQLANSGIEMLLSNILIFEIIGYMFFFVGYIWTIGFVLSWYWHTKKSAKDNLPMPKVNYRLSRIRKKVVAISYIAFVVCLLTGVILEILGGMSAWFLLVVFLPVPAFGIGFWIRRQIDTKPRGRKANRRLFIISIIATEVIFIALMGFSVWRTISDFNKFDNNTLDDRPALTLQDFGITDDGEKNTQIKGSVLVPINYTYWESVRGGSVNTEVYRSVSNVLSQELYKHFAEDFIKKYERMRGYGSYDGIEITYLSSAEAATWGADEGMAIFSGYNMELLLHREKTVLRLSIGIEGLSIEEAGVVVRRLW